MCFPESVGYFLWDDDHWGRLVASCVAIFLSLVQIPEVLKALVDTLQFLLSMCFARVTSNFTILFCVFFFKVRMTAFTCFHIDFEEQRKAHYDEFRKMKELRRRGTPSQEGDE